MSWSISTRDLKCVGSFEAAQTHWNGQKEWRNQHHSWRQLGNRRAYHKHLVKLADERGYQCVLFQTPMVTYFASGNVELRCHDSVSSNMFAWYVRPRGCRPLSKGRCMYWEVVTDEGVRYYRESREPLHLQPTAAGNWKLITSPAEEHEWVYDRKKGAEVQKALKNYQIWYSTTTRMGQVHPKRHFYNSYDQRNTLQALMAAPDDIALYPVVAEQAGDPTVVRNAAYTLTGAHYKSPVPYDRLPRERV
jgi:hypothetical protein